MRHERDERDERHEKKKPAAPFQGFANAHINPGLPLRGRPGLSCFALSALVCYDIFMSRLRTSIFELSVAEKIQLLEDLWDDIASDPSAIPVHEWQKEELDRRRRNLMENPAPAPTWNEIQRRVRSRHGR